MPGLDTLEMMRQIVDGAPEAIMASDRRGEIVLWNRGAEAMFGYSANEALGESLDLIIPENLRARHWQGYRQVMQSGETRYGKELLAVPALHRDGHRLSCEFSIVMLKGAAGETVGVAALMRDVSARWQRERELRAKLATLERRPI